MDLTKTIILDDVEYTIQELPLVKRNMVGFALAQISGHATDSAIYNQTGLVGMITGVLQQLEPEKAQRLLTDLLKLGVRFPKFKTDNEFNLHYSNNYDHQFQLAIDIVELNFGKTVENLKKKFNQTGIFTPKSSDQPQSTGEDELNN